MPSIKRTVRVRSHVNCLSSRFGVSLGLCGYGMCQMFGEFEARHCPKKNVIEKLNYKFTLNPAIDYALCYALCYAQFFNTQSSNLSPQKFFSLFVDYCQMSILFHCHLK